MLRYSWAAMPTWTIPPSHSPRCPQQRRSSNPLPTPSCMPGKTCRKRPDIRPTPNPKPSAFEARLLELLEEERVAVVVLAGFLRILSGEFVARYAGRILNVHPSLIPSFCGPGFYGLRVHRAALDAGVTVTGATVHLVDETPDGGPILMQQAVAVLPDDTPETLQRRVMEQAEWRLLPEAVERICQNRGTPSPAPPGRGTCPPAPPLTFPTGGNAPPWERWKGFRGGLLPRRGLGQSPKALAAALRRFWAATDTRAGASSWGVRRTVAPSWRTSSWAAARPAAAGPSSELGTTSSSGS